MAAQPRRLEKYDLFKISVAVILLILIVICLLGPLSSGAVPLAPATATAAPPGPTEPIPPIIQADLAAGRLDLVGLAAPNSRVQIQLDGQAAGTVAAGPDGRWTYRLEAAPGEHTLSADALDAAGQVAASSQTLTLQVPAPLAAPTFGVEVKAGQLQISGTGTPGTRVQVLVDGQPAETVTVGADGRWAVTAAAAPGEHSVGASTLDEAGQPAASAPPLTIAAPAPVQVPAFNALPANAAPGPVTLTGTGTPRSKVQISVDGQPAGTAAVGPDGSWSFTADLAAGTHTVQADALDEAGKTAAAGQPVPLTVGGAAAAVPTLDPLAGARTAGRVTITGTGQAGAKVQVLIDGQTAGAVTVGADGRWSFAADLAAGAHTVQADALDAAGKVTASSAPQTFTLAAAVQPTATPAAPAGTEAVCRPGNPDAYGVDQGKTWLVDRCDNLSYIARQTNIDLNALIAANPQIQDPNLIFPGQLITLPGR